MIVLTIFPLLIISVIIYNVMVFTNPVLDAGAQGIEALNIEMARIHMPSNAVWVISYGDLFLVFSLILLFIEFLRSTNSGRIAIVNHSLSMLVFLICLLEFLLISEFATSIFFFLCVMTFLDVMGGFIITLATARRDVVVDRG